MIIEIKKIIVRDKDKEGNWEKGQIIKIIFCDIYFFRSRLNNNNEDISKMAFLHAKQKWTS